MELKIKELKNQVEIKEGDTLLGLDIPYSQIPNGIFDQGLVTYQLAVYLYLCRCGNQGAIIFPSYATIAQKCGMSRRKAIYTIKSLVDAGWLTCKKRKKADEEGKNYPNLYTLISPTSAPPSAPHAPPSAPRAPYKEPLINNKQVYKRDNFLNKDTSNPEKFKNQIFTDLIQR